MIPFIFSPVPLSLSISISMAQVRYILSVKIWSEKSPLLIDNFLVEKIINLDNQKGFVTLMKLPISDGQIETYCISRSLSFQKVKNLIIFISLD